MLHNKRGKSTCDFLGLLYLIGSEYATVYLFLIRILYAGMSYLYLSQSCRPDHNRNDTEGKV